jgi:hypothetical protein
MKPYKRIPEIVIPDYPPRIIWVSDEAETVWLNRMQRISNAYLNVERENVVVGIRPSYLTSIPPSKVNEWSHWAEKNNLALVELAKEATFSGFYSSKAKPYVDGKPYTIRVAITQPHLVDEWKSSWKSMDNVKIGSLLGYPTCCQNWFKHYWTDNGFEDDILAMYENNNYSTDGDWKLNMFYRYNGVRLVSHMPCSFDCKDSLSIANSNFDLMKSLNFTDEANWIEEIMNWPVRWSSLHGIAEIRCPVFKLSHKSDFLSHEFIIDKDGTQYPKEGASGLYFPWIRKKRGASILEHKSFKDSLKDVNMWEDNGFSSEIAMNECHSHIVNVLSDFKIGSIIDLGCGNGLLLNRIKENGDLISTFGIEVDDARYHRATEVSPDTILRKGNMFDYGNYTENYYTNALLMPGRLLEIDSIEREVYIKFLKDRVDNFIFYMYGDWIEKYKENMILLFQELNINIKVTRAVKEKNIHIIVGEII